MTYIDISYIYVCDRCFHTAVYHCARMARFFMEAAVAKDRIEAFLPVPRGVAQASAAGRQGHGARLEGQPAAVAPGRDMQELPMI